MAEAIDFKEAIALTDGEDRALLIGNGFSAKYFSYADLLEKSGLNAGPRTVFDVLKTVDFEAVVRALERAAIVERAYGNDAHSKELTAHAEEVRKALVRAINDTHPKHREDLGFDIGPSAAFLSNFGKVFSLNYDLLLYWVNLEVGKLRDGFGLGTQSDGFIGPFSKNAYCELFNLHGGLHLFEDGAGETMKALQSGEGVIATITEAIEKRGRLPIYVAEGSSTQKMKRINSSTYLRHCYEMLSANAAFIFVYGHSADENDAHIYQAVFTSKAQHVYFGVYKPTVEKINTFDGVLAKYQKSCGSKIDYTFYDSESAKVWG